MKITLLLITLGIGTTILTGISYLRKGKNYKIRIKKGNSD